MSLSAKLRQVWGHGRITLLGDAAHLSTPMLSQGTSQAFEDALALGHAIGEHLSIKKMQLGIGRSGRRAEAGAGGRVPVD